MSASFRGIPWLFMVAAVLFQPPGGSAEFYPIAPEINLYYETSGEGPVVLFVHGWTMTSALWHRQTTVITLDLRSHGNSTEVLSGNTLSQQARDLDPLMAALELTEVTLVG